jgi:magnesium-transporting ATPase (P-type)
LLNGTSVVNESVLTGESTSVIKSNIYEERINGTFNPEKNPNLNKYILFTGSKII